MLEDGRISTRQHTLLIFCLFTFTITFGIPHFIIEEMKQDFWQSLLVTFGIEVALAVVCFVLGLRYPKQTMVQYSETVLGPWLGKLTGLSFVLFFGGAAALILHVICDILATLIMPETPIIVFNIIILLISTYAINAGLEVIGRLSEICGPVIISLLILILLLSLNLTDFGNLLPVFQHSPLEVFKASLMPTSLMGICIIMGMFMAYQNSPKETLKAKLIALSIGVGLTMLIFLQTIAVLGVNMVSAQLYPVFRVAQMIKVGDIIERLESLFIVIYIAGSFVGISALYWASTLGLAQILRLKKYQSLSPFTGGIILLISLFAFGNVSEKNAFLKGKFLYMALFVEVFLMSLLLVVSFLRHGKKTIYTGEEGEISGD